MSNNFGLFPVLRSQSFPHCLIELNPNLSANTLACHSRPWCMGFLDPGFPGPCYQSVSLQLEFKTLQCLSQEHLHSELQMWEKQEKVLHSLGRSILGLIIHLLFLEQWCPVELSIVMGMTFCAVQYGSHMWQLRGWDVASVTEELDIFFSF